jgi:Na+-transporting NADH:ubiquinone oxidoreductase subunit NqrB
MNWNGRTVPGVYDVEFLALWMGNGVARFERAQVWRIRLGFQTGVLLGVTFMAWIGVRNRRGDSTGGFGHVCMVQTDKIYT